MIVLALPCTAQSLKLNGPLAREISGSIGFPQTSPDGKTLVYVADRDGGPESELYALRSDGKGGPRRLSGALVNGYASVQFIQDGQEALFLYDLNDDGSVEIALAPLDGSALPRALTGPMVAGGNVLWFQASRDGLHVLYLADQVADEVLELFSVPLSGGAPAVRLNGALAPGGDVQGIALSNDGSLVLYSADQDTDEVVELFVAPVDGSSPARKLPIPLVQGGNVVSFQLDPGASRVIYIADQEEDERYELFAIPTDGSQPPLKLNGPLVPGGDVGYRYSGYYIPSFTLSHDGKWVVYTADQETDERFELYSVPADGSRAAVKLSAPSDHQPELYALSYDSAWAIYRSDPSLGTYEVFSAPLDGSAPARRISGPMAAGGDAYFPSVSYDSRRVVYAADQDVNDVFELYSAPIDGSAPPVKLNAPLPLGGDVAVEPANLLSGFYVMEEGVMYEADQDVNGVKELYFAPIAGGAAPRKLASAPLLYAFPAYADTGSPPEDFGRVYFFREYPQRELYSVAVQPGALPILLDEAMSSVAVGDVGDFLLSASGERAVYRAREVGDGEFGELYSVLTSKPSARVRLRSGLSPGFYSPQLFTPDERRVIYISSGPPPTFLPGLYSEPVDGSAPPVQLDVAPARNATGGVGGPFEGMVPLPDGRRLAFIAQQASAPTRTGLFIVPDDGSSPPVLLSGDNDPLPGLELSGDGSRIAFRSTVGRSVGLFVVPSDGSALPRQIDAGGRQSPQADYRISPDGERVFYRTIATRSGEVGNLFVAPSDASAAPVRLNAPLPSLGSVTSFALEPLGQRVVYLADQEVHERFELFSVPADGSAAPVRLHAPLSSDLDVKDFQISADARRVMFRGDLRTEEVFELFSTPLDAGRPALRISADLASGEDVYDYEISPDGKRVVYRQGSIVSGMVSGDLFSASIRSSRGQVKLSRPLIPDGRVGSFQISGDSSSVAFTAQRLPDPPPPGGNPPPPCCPPPPFTLMTAPIRGQEKASEIAGPFKGPGSVTGFQLSADGNVIVYRADQDETSAVELYAAPRPIGSSAVSRPSFR